MADLAPLQPLEAPIDARFFAAAPVRAKSRPWTTLEERLLREHYPVGGLKAALAALPGREKKAIYSRALRLGLCAPTIAGAQLARTRKYPQSDAIDAEIVRIWWGTPAAGAVNELARRVMRPASWIQMRAEQLGLTVPRTKPADWAPRELSIVEKNAHLSYEVIRQKLAAAGYKRTAAAIACKVSREGFERVDPDSCSGTQLARLLGVSSTCVARWVREEGLPARRRGTDARRDAYVIERKALKRWIATHAQLVDLRKVERYWFIDLAFGSAKSV